MPILPTWDARSTFSYKGTVKQGTRIFYGKKPYSVYISENDYAGLLAHFRGRTVNIGTSRDNAPNDSVGAWLQANVTQIATASYVGSILITEGYAARAGGPLITFL